MTPILPRLVCACALLGGVSDTQALKPVPAEGSSAPLVMQKGTPSSDSQTPIQNSLFDSTQYSPGVLSALVSEVRTCRKAKKLWEKMETRYEEQIKELKSQLSTAEKTSETLRKSFKTCTNDPAELHRIVKIFENMRAKNAAAILELLPGEMQALILRAMRERKAAPVLAQMNPQKASEATETLVDPTAAAAHASLDPSLRIPTTRKEILAQRVVKQKS